MSSAWLILFICLIVVVSAALPLLRQRGRPDELPPAKETLRDWRSDARKP